MSNFMGYCEPYSWIMCVSIIQTIVNIDPSGILAIGTVNDVKHKTLEILDIYKNSSRFILNAGCAIPAETPPENLRAMIKTARAF